LQRVRQILKTDYLEDAESELFRPNFTVYSHERRQSFSSLSKEDEKQLDLPILQPQSQAAELSSQELWLEDEERDGSGPEVAPFSSEPVAKRAKIIEEEKPARRFPRGFLKKKETNSASADEVSESAEESLKKLATVMKASWKKPSLAALKALRAEKALERKIRLNYSKTVSKNPETGRLK